MCRALDPLVCPCSSHPLVLSPWPQLVKATVNGHASARWLPVQSAQTASLLCSCFSVVSTFAEQRDWSKSQQRPPSTGVYPGVDRDMSLEQAIILPLTTSTVHKVAIREQSSSCAQAQAQQVWQCPTLPVAITVSKKEMSLAWHRWPYWLLETITNLSKSWDTICPGPIKRPGYVMLRSCPATSPYSLTAQSVPNLSTSVSEFSMGTGRIILCSFSLVFWIYIFRGAWEQLATVEAEAE